MTKITLEIDDDGKVWIEDNSDNLVELLGLVETAKMWVLTHIKHQIKIEREELEKPEKAGDKK